MSRMRLAARNWGLGASPIGTLWSLAYALVAAIVLLTTVVRTALAQEAAAEKPVDGKPAPLKIEPLRIGFAGSFKIGYWTPLEVTLTGGAETLSGQLELIVPDGDGVPTRIGIPTRSATPAPDEPRGRAERTVQVPAGQSVSTQMFAKIGQAGGELTVLFTPEGRKPIERKFQIGGDPELSGHLMAAQELLVGVGSAAAIDIEPGVLRDISIKKTVVATLNSAKDLPTRWFGYEGVTAVVISTSNPEIFRQLSETSARITALDQWVRMGGRLVVCVGKESEEIFAARAALAGFAPGRYTGKAPLRQSSALESYADSTEPLDPTGAQAGREFRLDVPMFADVQGRIEAYEGAQASDLPLVVRTPRGFGEVVFVGVDLDQPPLKNWKARRQFFARLLVRPKSTNASDSEDPNVTNQYGYADLAGQLRSALDQFSGVQLVPFWLVALLIVVYILCIGPFDYVLVKRVLRRMELTWVTFPAMVVAFSLGAYVLAYWLKGDRLRVNQVDVVDFDAETGLVRGTTWANVMSPQHDTFNFGLTPGLPEGVTPSDPQVLLSWLGLPGDGYGGMGDAYGRQRSSGSLFGGSYSFSPALDRLEGVPIAIWSTKGLTARWSALASAPVQSELRDKGDRLLSGSITSDLPIPLTSCVLLYDRWAYVLGTLEAQQLVTLDGKIDPQTIDTYFKHMVLTGEKDQVRPYDRVSLDLPEIMQKMMFYDLSGGPGYVRLSNAYEAFLDLSGAARVGRAVLVGAAVGGSELTRDGKPLTDAGNVQHHTWYRFVLPVSTK